MWLLLCGSATIKVDVAHLHLEMKSSCQLASVAFDLTFEHPERCKESGRAPGSAWQRRRMTEMSASGAA